MFMHWLRSEQQIYLDDFSNFLFFSYNMGTFFFLSGLYCTMGRNLKHIYKSKCFRDVGFDVVVAIQCGVKK